MADEKKSGKPSGYVVFGVVFMAVLVVTGIYFWAIGGGWFWGLPPIIIGVGVLGECLKIDEKKRKEKEREE